MLSVALAILMAIKTQTLNITQTSHVSREWQSLISGRDGTKDFWHLTTWLLKGKKFWKVFSFICFAPFLCRYLLTSKNSFFFFLLFLTRGLSKPALYRSMAETSSYVRWYQWPLVEADYLLLVHKSTCQPYLESRQLISMDYWNHLLEK